MQVCFNMYGLSVDRGCKRVNTLILTIVNFFTRNEKSLAIKEMLTGRSTFAGQRPMKSLLSVYLSVRLSVRPSLNFFKMGSLVFSDIVHDDS